MITYIQLKRKLLRNLCITVKALHMTCNLNGHYKENHFKNNRIRNISSIKFLIKTFAILHKLHIFIIKQLQLFEINKMKSNST